VDPQPEPPPGIPTWIGYVATLITQVGVPTVLAGVLLWFVLFRLDGILHHIEEAETERTRLLVSMQDTVIKSLDNQTERFSSVMQQNVEVNKRIADILERTHQRGAARSETMRPAD